MEIIKKIKNFYRKNIYTFYLCYPLRVCYNFFFYYIIPDKVAIKRKFYKEHGYKIDFNNLKTYSEKIQWLKLYDRKEWYSDCVDKFKVREFVSKILGTDKYLIPLYFHSKRWQDITYENMPDCPFVIKCNHDNSSYRIIKDKNEVDWKEMRLFYRRRLTGRSFFWANREWPYKNVKPLVMVEGLLASKSNKYILQEFKFHCFNRKIQVIGFYELGCDKIERYRHLDNKFAPLSIECSFGSNNEVMTNLNFPDKNILEEMVSIVNKIANDFEYLVRVDIYQVDGKLFIGELTFYDGAGFDVIRPLSWNRSLGSRLNLNL